MSTSQGRWSDPDHDIVGDILAVKRMAEVEHERLYWGARYEQDQDGVVWFTDENGQHYVLGQPVPVYGWEYMSRAEGMRIVARPVPLDTEEHGQ